MKKALEDRGYDNLDRAILEELQTNGRISVADLARKIHLSQPAVHNRIKRMERDGIINGYVALLDHQRLGYDLVCFVQLTIRPHSRAVIREVEECVSQWDQVLECYNIAGHSDMMLKVVVENQHQLNTLVGELSNLNGIDRIETSIVLNRVKATTQFSLD